MESWVAAMVGSGLAEGRPLIEAGTPEIAAALRPRGERALVLHLWASWCHSSVTELEPLLAALRPSGRPRFDLVFIALDPLEAAATAASLLGRAGGVPGRSLRATAPGAIVPLCGLDPAWKGELPATWVLDGAGRPLLAQRGPTDLPALVEVLARIPAPARAR